jgi:predicted nucleotidyltransferase
MIESKLSVVRRWVGDSELWLNALLENASAISSIAAVVVMGSAVRDRGHRRSDFDLVILFKGKRPSLKPPLEVDIRMYRIEAVEEQVKAGHEVLGWAMKFGAALYDPQNAWELLRAKLADRIPLPSAIDASERARKSLESAREMLRIGDDSAADDLILAGVTQLVRERLIESRIFPASRPELPGQLRNISPDDPLAQILEDAIYAEVPPSELLSRLDGLRMSHPAPARLKGT